LFISFFFNKVTASEEQETYANYSVEIIIFKYLDQASGGTELFNIITAPIDIHKEVNNTEETTINYSSSSIEESIKNAISKNIDTNIIDIIPSDHQILFSITPNNRLSLKIDNDRLKQIRVYEPIIWNGWQQIVIANELTPEIELRRLKNTLGEYGGYLKLYKSSGGKLRLAVDVYMKEKQLIQPALITQNYPNNPINRIDESITILKYPLSDDKEMKLDEIRYFDHPKYGILAKISQIQTSDINQLREEIEIKPISGNVINRKLSKKNYISSIERGIVGLGKTGKFISLTLNKNGSFVTNIADQLAIDKLNSNESASDTFIYTVSDGKNTQQKELIIEINGINDPPLSQDKLIELNNYSPYNFNLNDFFYEDAEESKLNHIVIKQLPKIGELYLEYPFGIWGIDSGMHISATEIPYLKYKSLMDYDQNLVESENEENSAVFFSFKVNDGVRDSAKDYKIIFQIPAPRNSDSNRTENSNLGSKEYINIIHLIQN
ncbi:MAG: VCBS repeat-containing protein, partial [Woeseiaceae bacterium]